MQNRFDLLVLDVMPIYMIIPRYSHNYACYSCGHDANIYEDEFAIVPYVKHEIVAIAPIFDSSLMKSMIAMMLL